MAGYTFDTNIVKGYRVERIKAAVRDSPVVGVDETGLRVAGGSGWIHVARTERLTHLAYDTRRGKAAMHTVPGWLEIFRRYKYIWTGHVLGAFAGLQRRFADIKGSEGEE